MRSPRTLPSALLGPALLGATLLGPPLLAAGPARAQSLVEPRGFVQGVLPSQLAYLNTLLSTAAGTSAATALLENGLISGAGARPPRLWRVLGYVMGAAAVGLGVVNMAASEGSGLMLGAGGALVGIGLLDLGLVSWGSRQPLASRSRRGPRVIFGPRVLTDLAGRPAYGLGLNLADW